MAERTRGSSEEMLVVEVVSSSRTPASLREINSAAETSTREESAALTARGTMTMVVVRVTSGAKIEMTREVIEGGKVAELIEVERAAERGLGGKGIPFSNHSIWKQRRKGEVLIKCSASEEKVCSMFGACMSFIYTHSMFQEVGKASEPGALSRTSSFPEGSRTKGFRGERCGETGERSFCCESSLGCNT